MVAQENLGLHEARVQIKIDLGSVRTLISWLNGCQIRATRGKMKAKAEHIGQIVRPSVDSEDQIYLGACRLVFLLLISFWRSCLHFFAVRFGSLCALSRSV